MREETENGVFSEENRRRSWREKWRRSTTKSLPDKCKRRTSVSGRPLARWTRTVGRCMDTCRGLDSVQTGWRRTS